MVGTSRHNIGDVKISYKLTTYGLVGGLAAAIAPFTIKIIVKGRKDVTAMKKLRVEERAINRTVTRRLLQEIYASAARRQSYPMIAFALEERPNR